MLIKLKIGLHLKLKMDIVSNFYQEKQWNYLEVLKIKQLNIKMVKIVHCNIVNNNHQEDSRVLYTFVPTKAFGSLLEISPTNHIFLKTFNS